MDHQWGDWHDDSYHDDAPGVGDDGSQDSSQDGSHDPAAGLSPDEYGGMADDHDPGVGEADDQPLGDLGPYADAGYPDDDPMGHYSEDPVAHVDPGAHDGWDDPSGEGTDLVPETLVGADPDLGGDTDDAGWDVPDFPEPVEISTVPEPVDGFPWSDPSLLGEAGFDDPTAYGGGYGAAPAVSDLLDYAGLDSGAADPWAALLGSDDPAATALAQWWAPGS
jgi:hypothetical protein